MISSSLPMPQNTVLIVAPHFPPATLAGVHRPRHLAKWLPCHGWQPVIIRVHEDHYTETLDPRLAELVPESVIQKKVDALNGRLTRRVGITDISLRSYGSLRKAVAEAIVAYHPRAVLITGSPYYSMLMTKWITQRFGVPVVLDFQDPWVSAWGSTLPKASKGGIAHQLAVMLEPMALRHAAYVTSVSNRQNDEMVARYPWLDKNRMAAIPIGGDPEDFDALLNDQSSQGSSNDICYVGSMWPKAEPVVDRICAGIARYAESNESAGQTKIRFVGTDPQLTDQPERKLAHLFKRHRLGDFAIEEPCRIPFLEAIATMSRSKGLLLFGSEETHYTASKIYPVLMSGRPFLSIYHSESSAHEILSRAGGGIAIGFKTLDELDERIPEIADGFSTLADHADEFSQPDPAAYEDFTASAVSLRYAKIFEEISR